MKTILLRKFLFFLFFLCFGLSSLWAQTETFYETYHYGYREKAYSLAATLDGGYIMTGFAGLGIGVNRIPVIKTDSLGNEEWHKIYGGNWANRAWAVITLPDGGYMIGGETSGDEPNSGVYQDIYLLRLDDLGDTLWTKTIYLEGVEYLHDMKHCPDGGFIIAGCSTNIGTCDAYGLKVDSLGNKEWDFVKSSVGNAIDVFFEVEILPDSGYVFGGDTDTYLSGSDDFVQSLLVRTDPSGNEVWSRDYGWWHVEYGRGGMIIDDNSVVLAGASSSFTGLIYDLLVLKVDLEQGDTIWTKVFDKGPKQYTANEIILANNGDYLISTWNGNNNPGGDLDLLRLSPEGEEVWLRPILNSPETEFGHDMLQHSDGSIVLSGETDDDLCGGCAFLMKITKDGFLSSTKDLEAGLLGPFSVFPNPATDFITIDFPDDLKIDNHELLIYSNIGVLLKNITLNQKEIKTIDISGYANGAYVALIKNNKGMIISSKVFVKSSL